MKIILLSVGKIDDEYILYLVDNYVKKINHYLNFNSEFILDIKNRKNLSVKEQKNYEGRAILEKIETSDHVVILDEKGIMFSSIDFAKYVEKKMQIVSRRLVFIIGGPYGFSDDVYNRADEKISLSKMTFTHQMVRLVFVEQLYRAMTIIKNESYHHK